MCVSPPPGMRLNVALPEPPFQPRGRLSPKLHLGSGRGISDTSQSKFLKKAQSLTYQQRRMKRCDYQLVSEKAYRNPARQKSSFFNRARIFKERESRYSNSVLDDTVFICLICRSSKIVYPFGSSHVSGGFCSFSASTCCHVYASELSGSGAVLADYTFSWKPQFPNKSTCG